MEETKRDGRNKERWKKQREMEEKKRDGRNKERMGVEEIGNVEQERKRTRKIVFLMGRARNVKRLIKIKRYRKRNKERKI